ncbi:MAG: hypothetical protein AAGC78_00365 [Cellvibrio sp.]|uniref:hypothetical protein n=1 Tax=Cellvibrio sp. TaxID=1965322 RepID=UPI0031B011BE
MLKIISFICLSVIPTLSFADTISCGGKFVIVSDAPSAKEPFFSVAIEGTSTSSTHLFEIQNDFLHLRCEVTSTGRHVILINNFCGGSGCAGFGNFGIIEVSTGKVLLEPNQRYKGNIEQATEIIGTELKPFTCELKSIEICLHSKIELG